MSLNRLFCFFLIMTIVSLAFAGCANKGCTDKNAINYNVVANKDDHTCKYCDSTVMQLGRDSVMIVDDNSSSSHYLQTVAKLVVTRNQLTYNDASCGDNTCSTSYRITNLSGQDFDLSYFLQCSSNTFFSISDFITLSANQTSGIITIEPSSVSNPCGVLFPGTCTVFLTSSIVYH